MVRYAALLIAAACVAQAAEMPAIVVSAAEAEPIRSAVIRKEAWTQEPVRRLREDAESRMREGPWTVTSERPAGIDLDAHEYYSVSPYWWPDPINPGGHFIRRDGIVNPAAFSANHAALDSMSDAVFTLGTAAYLLDDARCARRAARIVRVWFLAPKTRMEPSMEYAGVVPGPPAPEGEARDGAITEGRPLIRAIQGMEFLAQSGKWDPKEEAAARRWVAEYLGWLRSDAKRRNGDDNPMWRAAIEAAAASFAESDSGRDRAFRSYRAANLPGSAPPSTSASARLLAASLEPRAIVCRIAQVNGVDLWSVRAKNGETIINAMNALAASIAAPKKPGREQTAGLGADAASLLAFAGMGLNQPDYIALYRKLERPRGAWLALVDLLVGQWEASAHLDRH